MSRVSAEELLAIFKTLDTDGSNVVSRRELENGLSAAGVKLANIERLMEELDLNKDGNITFNEYKLALGLTQEPLSEWKQLFFSLDQDRTGTITREELKAMFREMDTGISASVIDEWIDEHDVNGDGQLSYNEFLGFVAEQSGH
ncbi:unnamed protein product [Echinostoma caproni]|uniref:Calmodulin n=1 Tax=Echinostoma caproni TaxID=27848 RepID=A0A183A4Y1_9TREM|nr:unnamed protein product [Echinostoma caproni]